MARPIALLLAVTLAATALGCDVDNDCENGLKRWCSEVNACGIMIGCPGDELVIEDCTAEEGEWEQCWAHCYETTPCELFHDPTVLWDHCEESCGEYPDQSP